MCVCAQVRHVSKASCTSRFSKLLPSCAAQEDTVAAQVRLDAFGDDPAFNPSSSLYNAEAAIREAAFYNTTPGSADVSASTGYPQVFQHVPLPGLPAGFAIFFPVCSSPQRVLHDGHLAHELKQQCRIVQLLQSSTTGRCTMSAGWF